MVFNVMLQLCNITRASKLFQRNFYLPLLKPLSPRDALRRKILTGKNVLGSRIEHYIPVLDEQEARRLHRKYVVKGAGKKRQKLKPSMRYLTPSLEDCPKLNNILARKSKGKNQCYTYHVPDKKCTLVFSHQMERAIRDKDILDVVVAQRSEKIVVTLKDWSKVTLPLVEYQGRNYFYRGEGWTRKAIEETHHHGKETMSMVKIFEGKEQGLAEWELELMRIANKRKRKVKGEDSADFKLMLKTTTENIDWDEFEEESQEIIEHINDPVDDKPIPMVIDDMTKTENVEEKLQDALELLPSMPEIPEIVRKMSEGQLKSIANVSGLSVEVAGGERFVPGQVVIAEEGAMFVPGQTTGESEYTPGFTVKLGGEPALIPGLVMGSDPSRAMFLPGESVITRTGELQFVTTEDDVVEVEEAELEEEQSSEEEAPRAPPPPPRKKFIFERVIIEPPPPRVSVVRRMGAKKRVKKRVEEPQKVEIVHVVQAQQVLYDMTLPTFEKDLLEQEKERVENFNEKKAKEETAIDKKRRDIRVLLKKFQETKPATPIYQPLEPVKKSEKLKELEKSIKKGRFFDVDHKKFLNKEYYQPLNWDVFEYPRTFDSVGITRHRIWKSVY